MKKSDNNYNMVAKKIIFLFLPLIVKCFKFSDREKIKFVDFVSFKKDAPKELNASKIEEWFDISHYSHRERIAKQVVFSDDSWEKLVLINYPRNLSQCQETKKALFDNGDNSVLPKLLLVNITNYESISKIQEKYLVCPICEISYSKKQTLKGNIFVCPSENKCTFETNAIEEFNKNLTNYYLENTPQVVGELWDKNAISDSIQIDINSEENLSDGNLYKKILTAISNV